MEGEEAHTEGHQEDNSKSESLLIVASPRVGPVAKVQRMSTWHSVTSARVRRRPGWSAASCLCPGFQSW